LEEKSRGCASTVNSRRATAILVVELIESKIMRHLEDKFLY
jgi:hypothetical protein